MDDPSFKSAVTEDILKRLSNGESMRLICSAKKMPDRETVRRWCEADPDLDAAITRAREFGYHDRAERAVDAAKGATDAALGRLAFDAERWYLGKLSKAFAEKIVLAGDKDQPIGVRHDMSALSKEQLEALAAIGVGDGED